MNNLSLTMEIPNDIKDLSLIYWMRSFYVETHNTRLKLNHPYSTLYIQKDIPWNLRKDMPRDQQDSMSFMITRNNIVDIQEGFTNVQDWFSRESLKELYGRDDEGHLMFNMDYRDLKVLVADSSGRARKALEIVPAPIEVGQGVLEPGAVIFINNKENSIICRKPQILWLCQFIREFNFYHMDNYLFTAFQYSLVSGNVLSRDETLKLQKDKNTQKIY